MMLALVFALPPVSVSYAADVTDDEIAAAEADATEKKREKEKLCKISADIETKYNEAKSPLDSKRSTDMFNINSFYKTKVDDLQKKVDVCSVECAGLHTELAGLKKEWNDKKNAVDNEYQTQLKALDNQLGKEKESAQKACSDATKTYEKAVEKVNDLKGKRDKDEQRQEDKEKKQEEKKYNKAKKDFEDAKNDIGKFCGSNYNEEKCQKAQNKMRTAEDAIHNYEEKYPDETGGSGGNSTGGAGDGSGNGSGNNSDGDSSSNKEEPKKDIEKLKKEYDKLKEEADFANTAYELAKDEYEEKEKAYYQAAFDCTKKEKPQDCMRGLSDYAEDLAMLKSIADSEYAAKLDADNKLNAFVGANPEVAPAGGKKGSYETLEGEANLLNHRYKQAAANCEKAKTFTTNAGKALMEKVCKEADTLKQAWEQAKKESENAKAAYDEYLKTLGPEAQGQFFMAGEGTVYDVYNANEDVFNTITRRAARILMGLRPLVYLFGAFGLVGFAFAAIFNKISWKWFANISIGLFLVANMGRLIDYMVYPNNDGDIADGHIDAGIKVKKINSFGDNIENDFASSKALGDASYEFVPTVAQYIPTPPDPTVLPDIVEPQDPPEETTNDSGFCKSGGIVECVGDILDFIENVTDTINTVKNTAKTLGVSGDGIEQNFQNIAAAIKKINPLKPKKTVDALQEISQNIQQALNTISSAKTTVDNNAEHIGDNWGLNSGEDDKGASSGDALSFMLNSLGDIGKGIDSALNTLGRFLNVF